MKTSSTGTAIAVCPGYSNCTYLKVPGGNPKKAVRERATAIGVTCSNGKECNRAARRGIRMKDNIGFVWSFLIENKQVTRSEFEFHAVGDRSLRCSPELGKTLTQAYERVFLEGICQ